MNSPAILDIDAKRVEASARLDPAKRSELGQFMTPSPIASFMASLFRQWPNEVRLLDPGAGVGSLTEAYFQRFVVKAPKGASLSVTAYEIDPLLNEYLGDYLSMLPARARAAGVLSMTQIQPRDFIAEGTFAVNLGAASPFTHAILNPPYRKISTNSLHRKLLSGIGIETVNLYAGFLALAVALTGKGGEIVAIVPRSFCNGTYFRPFREWLLKHAAIHHIHVFESRSKAFREDSVLQENIIIHLGREQVQGSVNVSSSRDASFSDYAEREVQFAEIVKPGDEEKFIHIPVSNAPLPISLFESTIKDLGLRVATGPVVDFRVKEYWLSDPTADSVPLLYAHHFAKGKFAWPRISKKPNALKLDVQTSKWLMPSGFYCVTKRFTSKEERRRVVAYVVDPDRLPGDLYGFENHLNVFHANGGGLAPQIAYGLATFLNSTVVDKYFRTFSGHTQVNATDLRAMRYPSTERLAALGEWAMQHPLANQQDIDTAVGAYGK